MYNNRYIILKKKKIVKYLFSCVLIELPIQNYGGAKFSLKFNVCILTTQHFSLKYILEY